MIRWGFLLLALGLTILLQAQHFSYVSARIKAGGPQADSLVEVFTRAGRIPFVEGDSVLFIYSGKANQVQWFGDFNQWGNHLESGYAGTHAPGSDIWWLALQLPSEARIDYKIVADQVWLLDPANPWQQASGVGSPNSELRMPDYKASKEPRANPKGELQTNLVFNSQVLGYSINYSVYLPRNHKRNSPVLYVLDGNEYLDPKLGNLRATLDELIYSGLIESVALVCLDHRNPEDKSQNRRNTELLMNESFKKFLLEEFGPGIERQFHWKPAKRGLMGTSLGGLTATYAGFEGYFTHLAIQSPAYWIRPAIYEYVTQGKFLPNQVVITTGTIHDTHPESEKMKELILARGVAVKFFAVPQGHSWGNWNDLLDEVLSSLFPSK